MKKIFIILFFVALFIFVGVALAAGYSEQIVIGHSNGNHRLDCTVIRPWENSSDPGTAEYPVIIWANGWGGNDVDGANDTNYYKPMLISWALDGPYIVVAANQWSVQERDVLACLQWILDQNSKAGSEYQGHVNANKIGLAGHSQGGGAVIKAGDGEPNGFKITTVVAMNPYGPSWVDAGKQDGPVLILKGALDFIKFSNTFSIFEAILTNDQGGVFTVLDEASHNSLDLFQDVIKLWWKTLLYDDATAGQSLKCTLDTNPPWNSLYAFTPNFHLACP